jgi:hypothetical protein
LWGWDPSFHLGNLQVVTQSFTSNSLSSLFLGLFGTDHSKGQEFQRKLLKEKREEQQLMIRKGLKEDLSQLNKRRERIGNLNGMRNRRSRQSSMGQQN